MTAQSAELRQQMQAAMAEPRRKTIVDLARSLEYASLGFFDLPEDLFAIYVDALSHPALCSTSGVEEFVSGLFNDFGKLSDHQREQLLHLFSNSGRLFLAPILRISASDLLARKYPHPLAVDTFAGMWGSGDEQLRDMAYSGAQVLSRLVPPTGPVRDALRRLGEMMNNKP